MKSNPAQKRLIWIGAAVLMVAAIYFAWMSGGDAPVRPAAPTTKEPAVVKNDRPSTPVTPQTAPSVGTMPSTPFTELKTVEEADQMIDEIIRAEKPIPEMARDLSVLVGRLNGEGQVNASRHLTNLTSDEDYGLIAGYLVDQKTNPEVIEVLFSDLMNRKRELQLPLFMNILKNPQHPQNEQVRNVMTILASQDFGTDYGAWDKWVADELKRIQAGE
jgi:hypothetical protein